MLTDLNTLVKKPRTKKNYVKNIKDKIFKSY